MKTLLLTLCRYLNGIDIGQQGSPLVLWSQKPGDRLLNWAPSQTTSQYVPLSTNRYLSFMPQDTQEQGGEIP
jgi:hypothetical protein